MCTTKVSPALATMSPLASINMPELSMATCPRGSVSTAKISPAGAATARCTSSRSGIRRLSHPGRQRRRRPPAAVRAGPDGGCVVNFESAGGAVLVRTALRVGEIEGLLVRRQHRDRGDVAGLAASRAESLGELTWLITAVTDVDPVTATQSHDQPGDRAGKPPRDVQRCAPAPQSVPVR